MLPWVVGAAVRSVHELELEGLERVLIHSGVLRMGGVM